MNKACFLPVLETVAMVTAYYCEKSGEYLADQKTYFLSSAHEIWQTHSLKEGVQDIF